jgi:hypothetical protein
MLIHELAFQIELYYQLSYNLKKSNYLFDRFYQYCLKLNYLQDFYYYYSFQDHMNCNNIILDIY